MPLTTPVAFFIFNRPELTARVFQAIRRAQPQTLLVVADGPRGPENQERCQQARAVIEQSLDWECQLLTNFAEQNMGCGRRVATGLDWVFSLYEEAIILEDDCLPASSFFTFCETLLAYYRHDARIMHISGNNFQGGIPRTANSYYFSKYAHSWGWASWRRAWQHYDITLASWPAIKKDNLMQEICDSEQESEYWTRIFEDIFTTRNYYTWDYMWHYACWSQHGLSIIPRVNLVSNIGFGSDATHTTEIAPQAALPTAELSEIQHPPVVIRHRTADHYDFHHAVTGGRFLQPAALSPRQMVSVLHTLAQKTKHKLIQQYRASRLPETRMLSSPETPGITDTERKRLEAMPRYTPISAEFFGRRINVADACTLLVGYQEIFEKRCYDFVASHNAPIILDCGSNIGLSVIFFKQRYPNSKVQAFEPDPQIFDVLTHNIRQFGFSDVELHQQAVWTDNMGVDFWVEGGFSGRIPKPGDTEHVTHVPSVRLFDLLETPIDFLKLDIEGAEYEVLNDCRDRLQNVGTLFIEYHSHSKEPQWLHAILAIVHETGFRYHLHEAFTSPMPFLDHRTLLGMDLQLNIFAYRDERHHEKS